MKLLICIPYFSGDFTKAVRLIQFITDIQAKQVAGKSFAFSGHTIWPFGRQDAPQMPQAIQTGASRYFNYYHTWASTMATTRPAACNEMAIEAFNVVARGRKKGQHFWRQFDGILIMEPDCVPCSKDWLTKLSDEWKLAVANAKLVMGCYRSEGVDVPHVNGNAVYAPEIADLKDFTVVGKDIGWDSAMGTQLNDHRWETPLISNLWNEEPSVERMEVNPFMRGQPCMIHGVKSDVAWNWATSKVRAELEKK